MFSTKFIDGKRLATINFTEMKIVRHEGAFIRYGRKNKVGEIWMEDGGIYYVDAEKSIRFIRLKEEK